MSYRWLARLRNSTQLLSGTLAALLGLRLMTLAVSEARARNAPRAAPGPPVRAPAAASKPSGAPRPVRTLPRSGSATPATSLRLMLSVTAGPARSEIFVNGSPIGFSPYVGDLSCKQGERLQIDVVPVREALITRFATCEGRTLLIR